MNSNFNITNIYVGGDTSPKTQSKYPIAPFVNNLPVGTYKSEIVSISPIEGRDKALEIVHTLIDTTGKIFLVKFCYYEEGVDRFINALAGSGYVGNLVDVVGHKEVVEIKHGKTYAYIAYREKFIEISIDDNPIEDNSDQTVSEEESSSSPNGTVQRRRGGLASYRHRSVGTRTPKAKNLLNEDEDEDDEFDDFFENDE